jgi:mannosyltransferase OCH1-like enzyme
MIPLILHHVWIKSSAEDEPSEFLRACANHTISLHFDWQRIEHTSPDLLTHHAFAHIRDPLLECWVRFAGKPTARSDLYRLMALYVHGGVYVDHDVWALRPFDDLLSRDLLLAADRMKPLLIGEHVMGAPPRHPLIIKIIWRFILSDPSPQGHYSPRLTRWAIESGLPGANPLECMAPAVFCPAPRIVETEDEAYQVFPQTRALHCWSRFPDGRDVEYDLDRLNALTEAACLT